MDKHEKSSSRVAAALAQPKDPVVLFSIERHCDRQQVLSELRGREPWGGVAGD